MCIRECVRKGFSLYYYIIYFFTTNERQQKRNIAVSASRPLLVLSEVRTSTPMITTWKVRGQRTQRRAHTPHRVLCPVTSASAPSGADPVLKQCDLQSACPDFVVQDSSV